MLTCYLTAQTIDINLADDFIYCYRVMSKETA